MREPVSTDSADLKAISETLRGNTGAFSEIVDRYQALVYRLAYSYLGNHEDAQDAAQDAFVRVYKRLGSFQMQRRFLPWLYSVVLNHLKTRRGRVRRIRLREEPLAIDPARLEDPLSQLVDDERVQAVRTAVRDLPESLRAPVVLYYLEEMSVDEVCEVLDLGRENVKSRLFRARKALRKALEKHATDEETR
jgi:RNA polymerase sigma-70 factor (ECF subfamily)